MHPIDIDEAKEYLQQIKGFEKVIHNKQKELKQLEEYETSITVPTDREAVQTSGTSDKVLDFVLKLERKREEIQDAIITFLDEKSKRIKVIELVGLENTLYYDLLYKHYVEYKKLTVVASELPKSYPYTLDLHGKALEKVAIILKNQQNPM
jgi:hypothetical protein